MFSVALFQILTGKQLTAHNCDNIIAVGYDRASAILSYIMLYNSLHEIQSIIDDLLSKIPYCTEASKSG